jgi:L-galactose dehydrogenase
MKYHKLGARGPVVSAVSLGTSPLGGMFGVADESAALSTVRRAVDVGITFFDTSPYYGDGLAERRLGRALHGERDRVIIGTKAGRKSLREFDFSPESIRSSLDESLRRLGTDHVDIFQLHDIEYANLDQVIADSYAELVRLRDEGKCRYIGMTGYPTAALRTAITATDLDVVLSYAHYTLLDSCLATKLLPVARRRGVGVINAAALALGLLTRGGTRMGTEHPAGERIRSAARRAVDVCVRRGADVAWLANQYSIQRSGCASTVVGTVNPTHLDAAVAAVGAPIDEDLLAEVLDATAPVRNQCWLSGLPENN